MTTDPPVGERELDADGWPVGMTREQLLAEVETTNATGARDRYEATLSADGSTLVGTWRGAPGRTFSASSHFRRLREQEVRRWEGLET